MNERKYSVLELDALRSAVDNKYLWGSYSELGSGGSSRCFQEEERVKVVEEQVRTHMLAGHTAEDLIASERPHGEQQKPGARGRA